MTRGERMEVLVRLACLTESRTNQEQRALLEVARALDTEINRVRRRWFAIEVGNGHVGQRLPDPSDLEGLVDATRVLDDHDKPVALKARKRVPWVDPS